MRALVLLLPFLLLAGCAQLDQGKAKLDEAQQKLDEAKREAQEAKDRYERVRSATIVRTEKADVRVYVEANTTADGVNVVSFRVEATRGSYVVPRANLTSAPLVAVRIGDGPEVHCDPVDCVVRANATERVHIGWADEADRRPFPPEASCSPGPTPHCAPPLFSPLFREDAEVGVTTAAGDVAG